jgi:transaldolase
MNMDAPDHRVILKSFIETVRPRLWVAGPVDELLIAAKSGLADALVTNPKVLADWSAAGSQPVEMLAAELAESTGLPVYLHLRGPDEAAFLRQAEKLRTTHPLLLPKLPADAAGLAATCRLAADFPVLVTGVATLAQVFAAHAAGARFVCPYFARLRDTGVNVVELLEQSARLAARFARPFEIVPASVRDGQDVKLALSAGATGVIIFTGLFGELLRHETTEQALAGFEKDWTTVRTNLK